MYSNLLSTNDMIIQPHNLKTELMQHQKTATQSMINFEQNGEIDFNMTFFFM